MKVRVYVEGGGDQGSTKAACRKAFSEFFQKIISEGVRPKVIAAGGRQNAFDGFKTALASRLDAFVVLLVDSEDPVTAASGPWSHLKERDQWDRPQAATDDQAQLMVQCMESWFLADKEALAVYYGQGFNAGTLPSDPNIENIPKRQLLDSLSNSTRATQKEQYHKTRHGFDILERIDPVKVRAASYHAERLCAMLINMTAAQTRRS